MKLQHAIIAILVAMIWGANFVVSKAAVYHFQPLFCSAIRLFIVGFFLLPFIKKQKIPMKKLFFISLSLMVLHFSFMFEGLARGLDVSIAVVVDQMRVPFAALLGVYILNERLDLQNMIGMVVAILGTLIIVELPDVITHMDAFLMIVISGVAWACYNIQVKKIKKIDLISFIGITSLIGAPQLFLLSFIFEDNQLDSLITANAEAFLSLSYIAFVSTIIAHGFWYQLLQSYKVNQIVPYSLLVPVFGTIFAVMAFDEVITNQLILGSLITILGVAIIIFNKSYFVAKKD